mgnify:FL=1
MTTHKIPYLFPLYKHAKNILPTFTNQPKNKHKSNRITPSNNSKSKQKSSMEKVKSNINGNDIHDKKDTRF